MASEDEHCPKSLSNAHPMHKLTKNCYGRPKKVPKAEAQAQGAQVGATVPKEDQERLGTLQGYSYIPQRGTISRPRLSREFPETAAPTNMASASLLNLGARSQEVPTEEELLASSEFTFVHLYICIHVHKYQNCICSYIHTVTYICTSVYMYAHIYMYILVCTYVCANIAYPHMYMYIYLYIRVSLHMYICSRYCYRYRCICKNVCIYVCPDGVAGHRSSASPSRYSWR